MSQIRMLDPSMKGWQRVWELLVAKYGDSQCSCPETGEVWQYMGSTKDVHQFRHRSFIHASMPFTDPVRAYDQFDIQVGDFDPYGSSSQGLDPSPNGAKPAINDHVCPGCKNDRCSKTERICWKCGEPL